jgi:spore coat polysaccharide biosynthesis protein SpsF (cytidylyltransferase family)
MKTSSDTEVWGRYFTDVADFTVVDLEIPEKHRMDGLRLTLDYPEDFAFFQRVFKDFDHQVADLSIDELLQYFRDNPEVKEINYACEERYKKRWESQNKIELKSA